MESVGLKRTPAKEELPEIKRQLLAALLQEEGIESKSEIPRRENHQEAPLSYAQQRLWFLDQLDPGSSAYKIRGALPLKGPMNLEAMRQAITLIISRHEALRTVFPRSDGEPVQKVLPPAPADLPLFDLSHLPLDARGAEAKRLVEAEESEPFDLVRGPQLRTRLIRLAPDEHLLLVSMHHIISDGWSLRLFLKELGSFYAALVVGEQPCVGEFPIQYSDYAAWQRQWLQGTVFQEQQSYWRKQLDGATPVLELPYHRARPKEQTFRGDKETLTLSTELSQAVHALSRQRRATPFMTMLAAFQLLLSRLSGQDDILVGTPMSGRNHVETEPLIGFFVNTLVLRTDLGGNPTFTELLQRVRETALGAYAHQEMPFEKLVEELRPDRDLSRTPLFQVMFNMLNLSPVGEGEMGGLKVGDFYPMEYGAKFDLTLYVSEEQSRLSLGLLYNTDLFSKAHMTEMMRQYEYVLAQVTSNPAVRVDSVSLVTDSANLILPNLTQSIQPSWGGAIPARISNNARRRPDQLAVRDHRESWKYRDLEKWSNRLANCLHESGIGRDDVVAVYAERSAALVCALLGIMKSGAAFLILDAAYPPAYLLDCASSAKPRALVSLGSAGPVPQAISDYFAARIGGFSIQLPLLAKLPSAAQFCNLSPDAPKVEIDPDSLAYVVFTSGSTGKPKGVLGTHRPLSHFLRWHAEEFDLTEDDRFSMLSGLAHDPLLRDVFTPLWVGAALYVPRQEDRMSSSGLRRWMKKQNITVAHLTPALGQILTDGAGNLRQRDKLTDLRYAFFGGDALSYATTVEMKSIAPVVTCVNFYGTTETPQAMAYNKVSNVPDGTLRVPIGKGIDGVQLVVLNRAEQLASIGELGELYVRTPYLAKGYTGNDELTRERFIPNPHTDDATDRLYRTGDLATYQLDGTVTLAGRRDDQVKVRGYRIELVEIETALLQHELICQAAVSAIGEGESKRIVAYLVPSPQADPQPQELRQYLASRLPEFMVPSSFVLLERIPITPNGKIDRRALVVLEHSATEGKAFVGPRDDLEVQVARIWEAVLGVPRVSIHDNFFDLGGHSLLAVRLFTQLEKVFGKTLTVATIFRAPTVERMAEILRKEGWSAPWSSLVALQPQGSEVPFFCVHSLGANLVSYGNLARTVGLEQPFYGLQPVGLDGKMEPHTRIEQMASHYVAEIRALKPKGPYRLGGVCLGGVIAFEMARQLVAAGEEVDRLVLIDTYFPGYPQFMVHRTIDYGPLEQADWYLGDLILLPPKEKLKYFATRIKNIGLRSMGLAKRMGQALLRERRDENKLSALMAKVKDANSQAWRHYKAQYCPCRIQMLWCSEVSTRCYRDRRMAWSEVAGGGLEVHVIPGNHLTMVESPHVNILAATLRACLQGKDVAKELSRERNGNNRD